MLESSEDTRRMKDMTTTGHGHVNHLELFIADGTLIEIDR
jgi:hypothetical protein